MIILIISIMIIMIGLKRPEDGSERDKWGRHDWVTAILSFLFDRRKNPTLSSKKSHPPPSSVRSSTHSSGPKIEDGGDFLGTPVNLLLYSPGRVRARPRRGRGADRLPRRTGGAEPGG